MATISGTSGNDVITPAQVSAGVTGGTPSGAADSISGGLGNDSIDGGGGRDTINGGDGNDTLVSGTVGSSVFGGAGDDQIVSAGPDTVDGGSGSDSWFVNRISVASVILTQTGATSFTLSGGGSATNVEAITASLGANATVTLREGVAGSSSFYTVESGRLNLNWSTKTSDSFINVGNAQTYGNIATSALAEVIGFYGFTSALIQAGSGNDTITGLDAGGSTTIFGGAGDDSISSYSADSIDGGAGLDTWNGIYDSSNGLTLQQTSATSFTLSNGTSVTGVEVYNIFLGAPSTVLLRSGGAAGRFSSVSVTDGTVTLDWSDKTSGSLIQAGNNTSYGSFANGYLADEVLSLYGFGSATLITGPGRDFVYGTGGNDLISTGAGNDVLVGYGGNDTLQGGAGDDEYQISDAGDVIVEQPNEGSDTVFSSVSYTLPSSVEVLVLLAPENASGTGNALDNAIYGNLGANWLSGGDGNDLLVGSDQGAEGDPANDADTLLGGAGDDTLDGGIGADSMRGGKGNDTYYVESLGDVVLEYDGGGTDTVISSITYKLTKWVEALELTGSANLDATGNRLSNVITGNAGNNTISGARGHDTLQGGAGDDRLLGNNGNDVLIGGPGADRLLGGAGQDRFRFLNASDGPDTAVDYVIADDLVEISAAGFGGGLVAGMDLAATGRYVENTSGLATSATGVGQFVFETDTSWLRWDPDGAGGQDAIAIVRFPGLTTLGAAEISIIA